MENQVFGAIAVNPGYLYSELCDLPQQKMNDDAGQKVGTKCQYMIEIICLFGRLLCTQRLKRALMNSQSGVTANVGSCNEDKKIRLKKLGNHP